MSEAAPPEMIDMLDLRPPGTHAIIFVIRLKPVRGATISVAGTMPPDIIRAAVTSWLESEKKAAQ